MAISNKGLLAALMAVMSLILGAVLAPDAAAAPNGVAKTSATADATNCTVQGLAQLCITEQKVSFSTVKFTDKETAVARASTKGALLVRWEFPKGWKPKSKVGCRWENGGTNSYISKKTNKRVWIDWTGKRAYICPDRSSSTGWRKAGGPPTWENCGNEFIPRGMKKKVPLYKGRYVVEQTMNITVTVRLRANINAAASAQASCIVPGASASATATGTGSAFVLVTGRATAKSRLTAQGLASGRARLSTAQNSELMLTASKRASVNLTASARAVCTAVLPSTPAAPTVPTPPTPPTPAAYSCAVTPILEKDGRLVRLNITTSSMNGPAVTVNWGDGGNSTNAGLNPSRQYGSDGTWNIQVSIRYNDGGTSSCSTRVTTNAAAALPPPPTSSAPGPNPPGGGTTGGDVSSCPPGWKPDPASPATGCVPA